MAPATASTGRGQAGTSATQAGAAGGRGSGRQLTSRAAGVAPGPGGLRGQDGEREEDNAGEKLVGAERRGGGVGVEQHACLSPQQRRRGRRLTEATAFAPNVTECYFQVTLHSFGAILRNGGLLMVFRENGDLSMVRDQFSLTNL